MVVLGVGTGYLAMSHHILVGCGYLGHRVGHQWIASGDTVAVLTRSSSRAKELEREGFWPTVGDVTRPATLRPLFESGPSPSDLLYAVGYDRSQTDRSIREVYAGGLSAVLDAAPLELARVTYISTTGVYGEATGGWIDESTPANPSRPGGIASLDAEKVLKESPFATRGIILRLAGIYGPYRLPYIDMLRLGEPLDASPEGYLNLIHVDDAAALVVDMGRGELASPGPHTYCVSDGHPVWREDFYRELAIRAGAPPPRFRNDPTSPRQLRGKSSKRVSNQKVRADLGFQPRYPSYREGLAQIARAIPKL